MIKIKHIALLFVLPLFIQCKKQDKIDELPQTILMDAEHLSKTKARLNNNDAQLKDAFNKLIEEANAALKEGPFSVTDKEKLAPSKDKNDYASYSRYWWPDPENPDGLPYIWKDGETNPESQSIKKSDRPRIGALGNNTETLGLAYYFTGEVKYAAKAAELIRVWFLDEKTKMNPNVNHAQCRLGHNNGTKSGVLDGRLMIKALEASLLIKNSEALTNPEFEELKTWAKAYFNWLTTNEMALEEADSNNNHGSFYDVQTMYFSLYSGNLEASKKIAQNFTERRLNSQIEPDGSMPKEMARTRPLFYSMYNLHAMFIVAKLAEHVNVDIWQPDNQDSKLKTALNYLVPYTDSSIDWPKPTIGNADRTKMFPLLQMANRVYPDENYLKETKKLSIEERKTLRSNLAFPLMR